MPSHRPPKGRSSTTSLPTLTPTYSSLLVTAAVAVSVLGSHHIPSSWRRLLAAESLLLSLTKRCLWVVGLARSRNSSDVRDREHEKGVLLQRQTLEDILEVEWLEEGELRAVVLIGNNPRVVETGAVDMLFRTLAVCLFYTTYLISEAGFVSYISTYFRKHENFPCPLLYVAMLSIVSLDLQARLSKLIKCLSQVLGQLCREARSP
ncbi:uncharacterized protein BDR25DRAFT_360241 [Lindgomyces ingoldianus]|uniref:Uncharacterized protein n=1 Tax=Lindgomyces ingoldianus TaxID=673940 RepID=A0ACB6QFS3_9PLEO|nr:uncharacterized protein BDR25DRAFT_360241 [Lindgomyces ingoldianus]KAF2465720.1 hypothetical protein BDR25DRAFT_360241 [Lindgomyces ingoldianus]